VRGVDYQTWRTGQQAACRAAPGAGRALAVAFRKKPLPAIRCPQVRHARFHQATKEFPHQEDVGFLELVIVAELND